MLDNLTSETMEHITIQNIGIYKPSWSKMQQHFIEHFLKNWNKPSG
jgi:hypothetical protein